MKKLITLLLLTILIIGCSSNLKAVKKVLPQKGYGDINKIEIKKFSYNGNRTTKNRIEKQVVVLETTEDIKKFVYIFNTKERDLAQFDMWGSDYGVIIFKRDGSKDIYDLALSKTKSFFHQNGTGYFINNLKVNNDLVEMIFLAFNKTK